MKDDNNEKEENKINKEKEFSFSSNQITVVTNSGYKLASLHLDKNFFENLLVLEMELEDEFAMEKLFELIKQYSIAIEYYLQNDQSKAKAYQNRMEYLLTNKDTLMQLKRQNDKKNNTNNTNNINTDSNEKNTKMEKRRRLNTKIKSQLNSKKGEIKLRQDDINLEDLSKKVSKFLSSSSKKAENKDKGKSIINEDLEKQSSNWRERLKLKKKISSDRLSIKPSGIGARYQSYGVIEVSPSLSDFYKNQNEGKKTSPFEELYGKKESINLDKTNENKIEEIKEETNEENKINEEPNKENLNVEEKKEEKNNLEENNKNEIKEENINNEDKKEETEKNGNIIIIEEEKEENNVNDKKPEENSKEIKTEENKDEKKEETPEDILAQKEQRKNSIEKAIESSVIEPEKKITEDNSQAQFLFPMKRRVSLTEEDLKIKPDEEISTSIKSQIFSLISIISDLNTKYKSKDEIDNEEDEESDFSNSNKNLIITKPDNNNSSNNLDKIPAKYREIYKAIEERIEIYINKFNQTFYQEIFEQFSSGLKGLYEQKYKKYIEIRNEYHNQIKENEYLLEIDDNLTKEKKEEIQQTIESLNEEQQHQIDIVEDEFNKKISDKLSEFKMTRFKHNSGIQLLEEEVKLDIYSLINEAF